MGSQESSHQVALANDLAHSHTHIPRLIGSVACDVGGAVKQVFQPRKHVVAGTNAGGCRTRAIRCIILRVVCGLCR